MDNRIRNVEENIKDKQMRNAYKEAGSLKAGFNRTRTIAEAQITRFYLRKKK